MKLARAAGWVFSGLVLATSGAYAQQSVEAGGGSVKASLKKAKPAAKGTAKSDASNSGAQREAEARATAELEARQRAEETAKTQAEIEVREKPLRDADELIKNGKPAEAYTLLEPLEFERAGEVRFDYLLGIAALDSGKPDKATLAFERVLAVDPNFSGARLDMARAYYQLGDLPRAKTEFETVMGQHPPAVAKATIQKYLDAIAAYEEAKKMHISGYVEGVVGNDSNVNTGTGTSISVSSLSPGLAALITGITGNPNPQIPPSQRRDNYFGVNAGGEISRSLGENWRVYAGADVRQHGNMVETPYDTSSAEGRAGVMYAKERNAYRLTLVGGQAYSANSMRRDSVGGDAEWQHSFSPADQLNTFAQYVRNRAVGSPSTAPGTDARTTANTDLVLAGAGWLHIMAEGKQAVFASAYTGKELDAVPPNVIQPPDGKRRFDGVRVGGQVAFSDQVDGFANLGWQHAIYSKPNFFIVNNDRRNEYQYDVIVGANWRLDKLWSVRPQAWFSRKRSNLALYSYDRTDISLTIRRDFR
ncbi:MAG TPA: tetratricopeptide repeat protein [Gallionella sp.]|nr:tetratricopeptide repeat protein [Gallionella sp.]